MPHTLGVGARILNMTAAYARDNRVPLACRSFPCRSEEGSLAWSAASGPQSYGTVRVVRQAERSMLVLLRAKPDRLEQLAEIPPLRGKTRNHPVVGGDRLYIRNAEEAVCYRLHRRLHEAQRSREPLRRL